MKVAQLDQPVYRYHRLETLQFSGHGSPVSVSIYNKCAEIQQKSQDKVWFYDLWRKHGWDGEAPVWRVECRLKREALHEMDIEETYQAPDQVPALWAYCVGHAGQTDGWVRMVQPNSQDSNRGRWKTASAWKTVQKAFESTWQEREDIGDIQRTRKCQVNLDPAEKAIAGYTTTYAAWLQTEKAGLPHLRFHDLRHVAATLLLSEGIHPKIVQEILGHSQISMTLDVYSHVLPHMQYDAMNRLNDLLGKEGYNETL